MEGRVEVLYSVGVVDRGSIVGSVEGTRDGDI